MWCCMEKERLTKVPIGCLKNKREYTRTGTRVVEKCKNENMFVIYYMNVHYYYYYYYYYHRSI